MLRRLLLLFALLFPATAFADMDYMCLKTCKDTGKITQVCMQECSYQPNSPAQTPKVVTPAGEQHKEFTPLTAPGQSQVVTGMAGAPPASSVGKTITGSENSKKTQCMQDCLLQKLQYSLCQQRCSTAK